MKPEDFNEEAYCLFAPDGSPQLMMIATDLPTCLAQIKMLHKAGMCKSYHELTLKGFRVLPVSISMSVTGNEENGYQKTKENFKP